jgi:uncharacterized protein
MPQPSLPPHLCALLHPQAYPHPVGEVQLIETHVSWVLLAGEFAYKIKRPVQYPFIDLRDSERRRFLCEEELRLNRRFAPELYLEVSCITSDDGRARIAGEGALLESAVRMRRFDGEDALDRLLARFQVAHGELEAFGRQLADIHAGLPVAPTGSAWGRPAAIQALLARNLDECAGAARVFGAEDAVIGLRRPLQDCLALAAQTMAARWANGRIRECHGDLHSRNVVRLGTRLVPFDCLEYEPAFRWIDVADEVAFLASDLCARQRPSHAHAFVSGYLAQSGDYPACRLLRLYEAHRALVRAKIAALSAADSGGHSDLETLREEHGKLVALASRKLARHAPVLLLMCGLSGSGKTWMARQLAERLLAVHVRSDVERKRGAGLDALVRSRSDVAAGLYSSGTSAQVYDDLARAAEDILQGGLTAVIDATFLRREQRTRFAQLGARMGVLVRLIHCEAPVHILRARIAARTVSGNDPSEADESVLDWQLSRFELPKADEAVAPIRIQTAEPGALEKALCAVREPLIDARAGPDEGPAG